MYELAVVKHVHFINLGAVLLTYLIDPIIYSGSLSVIANNDNATFSPSFYISVSELGRTTLSINRKI